MVRLTHAGDQFITRAPAAPTRPVSLAEPSARSAIPRRMPRNRPGKPRGAFPGRPASPAEEEPAITLLITPGGLGARYS
jgi:hypothetical protein